MVSRGRVSKGCNAADAMHARDRPAQHLARARRIELRRAARASRETPRTESPRGETGCGPADIHGRRNRQLRGGQLRGEGVLLGDLRDPTSAPAGRTSAPRRLGRAPAGRRGFRSCSARKSRPSLSQPGATPRHPARHRATGLRTASHPSPRLFLIILPLRPATGILSDMERGTILVTGGAGYIGSHTVLQLRARGERVVVLDNLYTGFRQSVLDTPLIVGSVGDRDKVLEHAAQLRRRHGDALSPRTPSCPNPWPIRSSTTATTPAPRAISCSAAPRPAYAFRVLLDRRGLWHPAGTLCGRSIAHRADQPLRHLEADVRVDAARPRRGLRLRYVSLRYFNVAGSDSEGRIGQSTREATLLVKVACQAAVGQRPHVSVFGTDYPTPDGTGVRDYIHVEDLATAHLDALDYLRGGGASAMLNAATATATACARCSRAWSASRAIR